MRTFLIWVTIAIILVLNYNIERYVLEDIQIITAIGYDYMEDDTMRGTVAAPFYPQGQDVKPINASFTASGHTIHSIRQQFQREAQRKLASGRLQSILVNKDLAERGVKKVVDSFGRTTFIGRDTKLAVVDGSTKKLLTSNYPNAQNLSRYLSDLLEESIVRMAPNTGLHSFLSQMEGFGQDPFLPLLKREHDHIHYVGLALFKDEKYVDSLSFREGYIFKMLYENFKYGIYEIKYKDTYISIENLRSKVKYNISGSSTRPVVTIHVSLEGKVQDAYGVPLHTQKRIRKVEVEWEKETLEKAEKLVRKLQDIGTDSLGIGEKVRSHFRHFNKSSWESLYPDVQVRIKIKTNIINTGIVE
ncbi:Ger(x)C family spore germination protein [Bacillus badius]|uniref:Spore germination protein n=1 Tax=Bacillus badius TaxID=1455 RepID=A0ABR5AXL3_BACBA|nr:Ger(x)C family spore germination protein [Bacillus badius]KIL79489.1 spore germination protein [Bacillus badius]MED4716654.1 Ger(x)C family spore germination protein [Bacillus badius]